MATRNLSMREFSRVFPRETAKLARGLQVACVEEVHRDIKPAIRALTPVGGVLSRDKNPGRLKRGWKTVRAGEHLVKEVNQEPHAAIIERGRKRGLTPRGEKRVRRRKIKGRYEKLKVNKRAPMLGSKQAPRGIKRPAVRLAMSHRPAILQRIFRKAGKL